MYRGTWVAFAVIGLIIIGVVVALAYHPDGHVTETSQTTSASSAMNDSSAGSSIGQSNKALPSTPAKGWPCLYPMSSASCPAYN
jgi:hypothetical protein